MESHMATIDKSVTTWDSHVQICQRHAQCMCITQIVLWYTWDSWNRVLCHMGLTHDTYGTHMGLIWDSESSLGKTKDQDSIFTILNNS